MIAVDTSAIVAIAINEPERSVFSDILSANRVLIATPTVLECHMVLRDRAGEEGTLFLDVLLSRPQVRLVDFDKALLGVVRAAFDRYGKATGHSARLNFGDCMAYAVARQYDVPLLYKGDSFSKTDIKPAIP